MNIVSFDNGKATWLFPLEELTPLAGADARAIVAAIAARYGFTQLPSITTREDMAKNGLKFGTGQFEIDGSRVGISDFVAYNDGIVAIAEKTEWAEKFLENLVEWTKREFGFRHPTSEIRKLYASTIIVDFEQPLSGLIAGYNLISELITSRTVTIMPRPQPLQFSRLDFEVDKAALEGQVALPKFILERRGGVKFSQERYYSSAPMHTTSHIEVLIEIERMLANR